MRSGAGGGADASRADNRSGSKRDQKNRAFFDMVNEKKAAKQAKKYSSGAGKGSGKGW